MSDITSTDSSRFDEGLASLARPLSHLGEMVLDQTLKDAIKPAIALVFDHNWSWDRLQERNEWKAILQVIEGREYKLRHIDYLHLLMSNLNKLPPSTPCGNGRNQLSFFTTAVFPAIEKAIQGEPREAQRQMETFCLARLNNPSPLVGHSAALGQDLSIPIGQCVRLGWTFFEAVSVSQNVGFLTCLSKTLHHQLRAFLEGRQGTTRMIEAARAIFFAEGYCTRQSMEVARDILKRVLQTGSYQVWPPSSWEDLTLPCPMLPMPVGSAVCPLSDDQLSALIEQILDSDRI